MGSSGVPVHADASRWNAAIDADSVRIAYGHLRMIALTALPSTIVMAIILRGEIPDGRLLAWMGAVWLGSGLRLLLARRFAARASDDDLRGWARRLLIAMILAGAVFGSLALLPAGEPSLLVIAVCTLAVGGHIAGGATALAGVPRVLLGASLAAVTPLIVAMVRTDDPDVPYLALMATTYLLSIAAMARVNTRALRETLILRYENVELAERLAAQVSSESEARAAAEAAGRDKTRLLAAASHDLRQPLQALVLFASALTGEASSPRARHLLERIDLSIEALRSLLDGLLDIARLDAGVVVPAPERFPAAQLGRELEAVFGPQAASRGLRLRIAATDAWIDADPEMVAQMARNLVANAIRYTSRGGVLVGFRRRGDRLRVEVWDTGLGIDAAHQRDIFREFFQVGNPERDRSKGVGLGLAIVLRLARLLGTSVHVASAVGRGSRFWFELPLASPGAILDEAARPAPAALRAGTVLVIDDDGMAREGLAAALEAWGYRVVTAADVGSAGSVAAAHAGALDAVVCDYRLPGGHTAVDALAGVTAAVGRALPTVIVTGDTDPARIRDAHATGHAVLFKPVSPDELRATLAARTPS